MKGLTIMKKPYFKPVAIKDVKLHGDFSFLEPTVTVVRVKNIKTSQQIPVVTCLNPTALEEEVGFEHTSEAYIRSRLIIFDGIVFDVEIVDWIKENDACRYAIEQNEAMNELAMSWSYDQSLSSILETSQTHVYSFRLPEEMLLVIPVDLNESEYMVIQDNENLWTEFIKHLAWKQLWTTLPIYDIKEVELLDSYVDEEERALDEMSEFVTKTIMEMFEDPDACYDRYNISVTLNDRTFVLGQCAKEYNGLLDYIAYMKSEV